MEVCTFAMSDTRMGADKTNLLTIKQKNHGKSKQCAGNSRQGGGSAFLPA